MLIYGVEALLRWQSETLGQVHPEEFIPIAEEAGLILEITQWILRESATHFKAWREESAIARQHLTSFSVNVSVVHLEYDLLKDVTDALKAVGLPPETLEIELTESAVMRDVHRSAEILRAIRELGVNISIDDFGTGYSSMKYLRMLPFDTVKIDKSFVNNIAGDDHNRFIVEAIISITKRLGNCVVAEGVESEEDIKQLIALGCIGFQGFYYAKPMPPEKIISFTVKNTKGALQTRFG
jgi:EAL domain-containing protein (putative c-di-GMP-specific phosphodiesterase class I)